MRYHFGQNEFGNTGITGWAEVEDGVCIDSEITVPSDTPQWLRNCIEAGFHQGDIIWDMIDAQDRDAEATADCENYHKEI